MPYLQLTTGIIYDIFKMDIITNLYNICIYYKLLHVYMLADFCNPPILSLHSIYREM